MYVFDLVLRWMHIFGAIILLGGTFFMRFAYVPAVATLTDDVRQTLLPIVRRRWAVWVMIAIAMLLISGLINMVRYPTIYELPAYYHALLGIKFLLALVIFYIASKLMGRSQSADRFRESMDFWLNVNLVLAILVVGMAGVMRFAPREEKDTGNSVPAPTVSQLSIDETR